jgi:sugar O-acyltransferase (sialic acid O-acetyltransferase NeuD family)
LPVNLTSNITPMILIGYSGHSYVINGILHALGIKATGYCDNEEKKFNPFSLKYYNQETSAPGLKALTGEEFFIAVGNNKIRENIYNNLAILNLLPVNIIHPSALIDYTVDIASHGVMIASNVTINPLAKIGIGVICNTYCVIEHECVIGDFAHIAPGAVLCGNVHVGSNSFIGAKSVIRENIRIGKNSIVGAGSVVVKDVPDNVKVAGNPARILK